MWSLEIVDDWSPSLKEAAPGAVSADLDGVTLFEGRAAALKAHLRRIRKSYFDIESALETTLALLHRPMSEHHRTTPGVWTLDVDDKWLPYSNLIEGASPDVADDVKLFKTRNAALRRHEANLENEKLAIWLAINSTLLSLQHELGYDGKSPRGSASQFQLLIETEPGRDE